MTADKLVMSVLILTLISAALVVAGGDISLSTIYEEDYSGTIPLNVTITNPVNVSILTVNLTWFNLTTNENANCTYELSWSETWEGGGARGGGSAPMNMNITGGTSHSHLVTGLNDTASNQNYNLRAVCTDSAENTNSSSVRFYVDTKPPIITIYSLLNKSYNKNDLPINVSISELVQHIKRSLDGGENITLCSACRNYNSTNLMGLSEGKHNLTIYATDYVNNSASLTVAFSIDTALPLINLTSLVNGSKLTKSSFWINATTNENASCAYNLCKVGENNGEAWRVGNSYKNFEFSESLSSGSSSAKQETIRNITTFITDDELPNTMADGTFRNSKGNFSYHQYMYFDNMNTQTGTSSASLSVVYAEDPDIDETADYFYIKNNDRVARYSLEFTSLVESDITDSSGSANTIGTFLWDMEGTDITLLGKTYSIVKARRSNSNGNSAELTLMRGAMKDTLAESESKTYTVGGKEYDVTMTFVGSTTAKFLVNGELTSSLSEGDAYMLSDKSLIGVKDILSQDFGGGVRSVEFYLGATKIFLKDTDVSSRGTGSQPLEVGSKMINDTKVTITGSDDNITFEIDTIELNITADDDFYVPAGGKLSSQFEKPEALLSSWDIEYAGLDSVPVENIQIKTSGSNQYYLEFVDGSGNKVSVPLAYTSGGANLTLGDNANALVITENTTIAKNDYFIVTDSSQSQGRGGTYAIRYKGASASGDSSPVIKFQVFGESGTTEKVYSSQTGDALVGFADAALTIGGATYNIWNITPDTSSDFSIVVDLNGNDFGETVTTTQNLQTVDATRIVNVTTKNGAQIVIQPFPLNSSYLKLANSVPMNAINISIQTPSSEDYDNVAPTPVDFDITAVSGKVNFVENTGFHGDHNYRSPQGESNTNYAYTTMGAKVKWNNPPNDPDTLEIYYPSAQRLPLLYVTSYGATNVGNLLDSVECVSSRQTMEVTGGASHSHLLKNVNDTPANMRNFLTLNCTDSASNTNTTSLSFYVDTKKPVLGDIRHSFVTNESAIIGWNLSESSNGTVEYGLTGDYGSIISDTSYRTVHKLALTGLQPATTYHYKVRSSDYFGNENVSRDFTFRTAVAENIRQTIPANETTTVSSSVTNTTLDIVVKGDVTNVAINITSGKESPTNKSLNVSGLKYLDINVDDALSQMLSSVLIKIYYSDEEVSAQNLTESSLGIYLYNSSLDEWVKLDSSMDWVFGTGVDEANNYVWVNVSHFSSYGAGGLIANGYSCSSSSQCSSGLCSNNVCSAPSSGGDSPSGGGSSGGGGGGGGRITLKPQGNETQLPEQPPTEQQKKAPEPAKLEAAKHTETTKAEGVAEEGAERWSLLGRLFGFITGRAVTETGAKGKTPLWPSILLIVLVIAIILRWKKVKFGPLYFRWYVKKLRFKRI